MKQETSHSWLHNVSQALRSFDYHFDSQPFENRLDRWGIEKYVAIYISRFHISEIVFSRFGNSPRATHADFQYTGSGETRLLDDLMGKIKERNPRIPSAQRPMFMRFMLATAAEELVKQGQQIKDAYVVNQVHLTARRLFLNAAELSDKLEQRKLDQVWKNETIKLLTDNKSLLSVIHARLMEFVDNPPVDKTTGNS